LPDDVFCFDRERIGARKMVLRNRKLGLALGFIFSHLPLVLFGAVLLESDLDDF
jgi:hypothetical protein